MKLTRYENIYFINSKVLFKPSTINTSIISKAFEFAFEMAFEKGHHRKSRTGGTKERTSIEIFRNTLQGKIAEGVAFDTLAEHDIKCDPIDYNIHGKGIWDDTDLEYKDIKISIKSVAHFSNLLLLETEDWNEDGSYKPNTESSASASEYDYFILVRLKPNTNSLFNDELDKKAFKKEIEKQDWAYDIPGCCSIKTLRHIIANDYLLPQNALLNGKTKMDAENYYIQTGSLIKIDQLITDLKTLN